MRRFTLPKSARLKSQKIISDTFGEGKTVQIYPLRIHYTFDVTSTDTELKIAFTVSKRNFRRAVDRNRIKRLMREAYRLNQYLLKDELGLMKVNLVFLYYIKDELSFSAVEKAAQKALKRLAKDLKSTDV